MVTFFKKGDDLTWIVVSSCWEGSIHYVMIHDSYTLPPGPMFPFKLSVYT